MKDPLYTLKRYKIVNKKLRQPKTKIVADLDFLPIAEKYDCGFTYQEFTGKVPKYITIGDLTINIDCDGLNYLSKQDKFPVDYDFYITEGILKGPQTGVIASPFCSEFWSVPFVETRTLEKRQGWSCVMRASRPHRDTVNDIIATSHRNQFTKPHYYHYDEDQHCQRDLTEYMMRNKSPRPFREMHQDRAPQENSNYIILDSTVEPPSNPDFNLGPWHDHTLCELVVEASASFFFPTEKTIKPIVAGMPFVVASDKGFLRKLRQMGFCTFHPYINESYDHIDNQYQRFQTAIESFFNFVDSPNNLSKIKEICNHNQQIIKKIRSHDQQQRFWKKIRRFIEF